MKKTTNSGSGGLVFVTSKEEFVTLKTWPLRNLRGVSRVSLRRNSAAQFNQLLYQLAFFSFSDFFSSLKIKIKYFIDLDIFK